MQVSSYVDVHNHCVEFSPDASQPLLDRIKEAKANHLAGIVMTDHYDKDLVDEDLVISFSPMGSKPRPGEWIFYLPEYLDRLTLEREKLREAKDPFQLLIGIELGYAPVLVDPYREMIRQNPFDSVICSLHSLEFKDVYYFKELYQREKQEVYQLYLACLTQMVKEMEYANILGHFDYISRYSHYSEKKMYYRDFADEFDALFQALIDQNMSLELNSGSQRAKEADGQPMGLPDPNLLIRYRELGGQLISLGSDAHHEGFVAGNFQLTAQYVKSLGFPYLVHYVNQQPVFTPIQ